MKKPSKRRSRSAAAKKGLIRNFTASALKASAAPKGCCTISSEGAPDRDIPNITEAECDAIAIAHPESATHWEKGSCA